MRYTIQRWKWVDPFAGKVIVSEAVAPLLPRPEQFTGFAFVETDVVLSSSLQRHVEAFQTVAVIFRAPPLAGNVVGVALIPATRGLGGVVAPDATETNNKPAHRPTATKVDAHFTRRSGRRVTETS
jgi:hypothetical protein